MPGLPGAGLGGLFYLLCAFAMPVVELVRTLRGDGDAARRRLVARHLALALGIVLSVGGTYALLDLLTGPAGAASRAEGAADAGSVVSVAAILLTLGVLVVLVLGVALAGARARRVRGRPRARVAAQRAGGVD